MGYRGRIQSPAQRLLLVVMQTSLVVQLSKVEERIGLLVHGWNPIFQAGSTHTLAGSLAMILIMISLVVRCGPTGTSEHSRGKPRQAKAERECVCRVGCRTNCSGPPLPLLLLLSNSRHLGLVIDLVVVGAANNRPLRQQSIACSSRCV